MNKTYDLVIVGAGPVGLTIANYTGMHGLKVLVVEQLDKLIDYPRGVGMDDECLRAFQAIGLADRIVPHTTPCQWMRFHTARNRAFASIEPRTTIYGWPRRNAFIQPLADQVLHEGLERFENVEVQFSRTLTGFTDHGDRVSVTCADAEGHQTTHEARFLVGCDGGRSQVRKTLGIEFEGATEATQWLVVDLHNDPVGTPNAILVCDPDRPYVSIALPHGIRRLEFMVRPDETEADVTSDAGLMRLLGKVIPDPEAAHLIRKRVYTHNSRIAKNFRKGSVMLAGDAAHLMPVWQGQGYNSGIRDANNLAWKIVAVCKGMAGDALLDSYHAERHDHALAMINLSTLVGHIFAPPRRWQATLRDVGFSLLKFVPPVRDYILQMKFKPMPTYGRGVIVTHPADPAVKSSPVGQLFIQPRVALPEGGTVRLDDVLGNWFSLVALGSDPTIYLDDTARALWARLGGQAVVVVPQTQLHQTRLQTREGTRVVGDSEMAIKEWCKERTHSIAILRPDRFVAATCQPQTLSATIKALAAVTRTGL